MCNDEKILKNGSKAFQLVKQLKKAATACLQRNSKEKMEVIARLEDLEKIFKPYDDELQRLKEDKKKHDLEIKKICANNGHTGEWAEEKYFEEGWMGDVSDKQWVQIPRVRWVRTCTRCGKKEVSETEPEEVRRLKKIRKIEEMEEQIKRMKAEL